MIGRLHIIWKSVDYIKLCQSTALILFFSPEIWQWMPRKRKGSSSQSIFSYSNSKASGKKASTNLWFDPTGHRTHVRLIERGALNSNSSSHVFPGTELTRHCDVHGIASNWQESKSYQLYCVYIQPHISHTSDKKLLSSHGSDFYDIWLKVSYS